MQVLKIRFATPLLLTLTLLLGASFAVAAPANHPAAARGIGSAPAGLVAAIARTQA
jgi:hypothetical protein